MGVNETAKDEQCQNGRRQYATAIGREVGPFAATRRCTVGLHQFDEAAHQDGDYDGTYGQEPLLQALVMP
jgi:hypothetical protein